MTKRDRLMVVGIALLAVVGGFWFLALKPRQAESKQLDEQIAIAQQERDAAQQAVSTAGAPSSAAEDAAILARLGKAVPADDDVASLVYQLEAAAGRSDVSFEAVKLGGATASAPAGNAVPAADPTQAATAPLPPGAVVGPAGLAKLPFSLTFEGSFFGLERFLKRVHAFTSVTGDTISVRGRLLQVDAISLTAAPGGFPRIQANLAASAFIAPVAAAPAPDAGTATTAPPSDQAAAGGAPPTTPAVIVGAGG
jgi:hypothetical protein